MLPNGVELAGKIRMTDRQNTEWGQADTKFVREGEKHSSDMLTDKARRGLIGAQTGQANAAADHYRSESPVQQLLSKPNWLRPRPKKQQAKNSSRTVLLMQALWIRVQGKKPLKLNWESWIFLKPSLIVFAKSTSNSLVTGSRLLPRTGPRLMYRFLHHCVGCS